MTESLYLCLSGSLFAGAVLLLRRLGRGRLPQRLFYWLWNLTLLLFFLPLRLPSPFSLYNLPVSPAAGDASPGPRAACTVPVEALLRERTSAGGAPWLRILWAAGAGLALCFLLAVWLRWRFRLRPGRLTPAPVGGAFCSAYVRSPCVYGCFRGKILFPPDWDFSAKQETELALAHERCHIAHRDPLRKAAFALLLCLQWFNPLVWAAYAAAARDMELYCDECLMRTQSRDTREAYARMLLRCAASPLSAPLSLRPGDKQSMKERIVITMKAKTCGWAVKILSVACAAVLVLLFATGASRSSIPLFSQDTVTALPAPVQTPAPEPVGEDADAAAEPRSTLWQGEPTDVSNGGLLLFGAELSGRGEAELSLLVGQVEGYEQGQSAEYGCVQDGQTVPLGTARLCGSMTLNLTLPEEGFESLYLRNYCADTIHILSLDAG